LLSALQYESLEEAVAATVDAYVTLLLQLVQQHNFRIYVHPVPPVLDETLHIASLFNTALHNRLTTALQAQPELIGRLAYLAFAQQLVAENGSSLQQQLAVDNTHLHPRYLVHLEAKLNAALHVAAVDG
jgi:lysophospholipase L1-like esterase